MTTIQSQQSGSAKALKRPMKSKQYAKAVAMQIMIGVEALRTSNRYFPIPPPYKVESISSQMSLIEVVKPSDGMQYLTKVYVLYVTWTPSLLPLLQKGATVYKPVAPLATVGQVTGADVLPGH